MGIIQSFPIELGGKIVNVDVEVVDSLLDYNLLLGQSWSYDMVSTVFVIYQAMCFPMMGEWS